MPTLRWDLIKRLRGLPFQSCGAEHSGWLPAGAAIPLPTPISDVVLDIEIRFDGHGYFLCCESRDGAICTDDWFESLADTESAAAEKLGIEASQWETTPFAEEEGE